MNLLARRLQRWLRPLRRTPIHPQWFVELGSRALAAFVRDHTAGTVVDIGCGRMEIARYLVTDNHRYIGLDHPAPVASLYHTRPQVYADAQCLPIRSAAVDVALIVNVLEHLHSPDAGLTEIRRILRVDGVCVAEIPFIYPLHDRPFDYFRWTAPGIEALFRRHGLAVREVVALTQPLESVALMLNLAVSRTIVNALIRRSPVALLLPFAPLVFLIANTAAFMLSWFSKDDAMPYGYRVVAVKITE